MVRTHDRVRFEQLVLPHLDSAANLARWLLLNSSDVDDLVQEAMLRAYRFSDSFQGTKARTWLLQIVRNTCYSWLKKNGPKDHLIEFDEELPPCLPANPEILIARADERHHFMIALESLPTRSREVLVLRELEGCSHKEIAEIVEVPLGTVMSTLSLARKCLQQTLISSATTETSSDL